MPRKPRFYLPGVPVHVVQRGNSRQAVFFEDNDYLAYLTWLSEGAEKHGCLVHAYVLMTNHVHLLLTPATAQSISRTIQYVGRHRKLPRQVDSSKVEFPAVRVAYTMGGRPPSASWGRCSLYSWIQCRVISRTSSKLRNRYRFSTSFR